MNLFKYLHRWTGIALILAGIYIALQGLAHPLAVILALVGLAGLHFSQGKPAGRLSFAGLIVTALGTLIYLVELTLHLFPGPAAGFLTLILRYAPSVAEITLILGYILMGVAVKLAGVYNGNNGVILAFGAVFTVLSPLWGAILLGFGMIWLGYSLYADKRITQPLVRSKVANKGTRKLN